MTARTWKDAEIVAQRMNARILPEGCEGGHWDAARAHGSTCVRCGRGMSTYEMTVACDIGGGCMQLCLDCALLDCMGVKS